MEDLSQKTNKQKQKNKSTLMWSIPLHLEQGPSGFLTTFGRFLGLSIKRVPLYNNLYYKEAFYFLFGSSDHDPIKTPLVTYMAPFSEY